MTAIKYDCAFARFVSRSCIGKQTCSSGETELGLKALAIATMNAPKISIMGHWDAWRFPQFGKNGTVKRFSLRIRGH